MISTVLSRHCREVSREFRVRGKLSGASGSSQSCEAIRHRLPSDWSGLEGRRGLVRVTPQGEATLALAGANIVGLAFSPLGTTILATSEAVYEVDLGVEGDRKST